MKLLFDGYFKFKGEDKQPTIQFAIAAEASYKSDPDRQQDNTYILEEMLRALKIAECSSIPIEFDPKSQIKITSDEFGENIFPISTLGEFERFVKHAHAIAQQPCNLKVDSPKRLIASSKHINRIYGAVNFEYRWDPAYGENYMVSQIRANYTIDVSNTNGNNLRGLNELLALLHKVIILFECYPGFHIVCKPTRIYIDTPDILDGKSFPLYTFGDLRCLYEDLYQFMQHGPLKASTVTSTDDTKKSYSSLTEPLLLSSKSRAQIVRPQDKEPQSHSIQSLSTRLSRYCCKLG